jgi:hypothetical protein
MTKDTDDKSGLVLQFLWACLIASVVELGLTHFMGKELVADSVFNLRTVYQNIITIGQPKLRQSVMVTAI